MSIQWGRGHLKRKSVSLKKLKLKQHKKKAKQKWSCLLTLHCVDRPTGKGVNWTSVFGWSFWISFNFKCIHGNPYLFSERPTWIWMVRLRPLGHHCCLSLTDCLCSLSLSLSVGTNSCKVGSRFEILRKSEY